MIALMLASPDKYEIAEQISEYFNISGGTLNIDIQNTKSKDTIPTKGSLLKVSYKGRRTSNVIRDHRPYMIYVQWGRQVGVNSKPSSRVHEMHGLHTDHFGISNLVNMTELII